MTNPLMPNIFETVRADLMAILESFKSDGTLPADICLNRVSVEPPRDITHGDMATNSAMVLAKPAGKNPRELADSIVAKLCDCPLIASADVAGPGFINIKLTPQAWGQVVPTVLSMGQDYGYSTMGQGQRVNVEYVSANPTGPLHIGHARGAVFGDCLSNLLSKTGYDVTKEYYINDAGNQVKILAQSTYLRYCEALGDTVTIPEGLYPGEYLKQVGQSLAHEFGDKYKTAPESEYLPLFQKRAVDLMMESIKATLSRMGINHDVYYSEAELVITGKVENAYQTLTDKGLIYEGTLEPPKGKLPDDWETRPQMLFKATQFGDDEDRSLKKADGDWTYFANDIAYHHKKYATDGNHKLIDILGADHGGYIKRMKAATTALADGADVLDIKTCQVVKLLDNGEPLKMSKRAGTFVTLDDLIDAVGADVVRFFMMTRKPDAQMEFDLTKVCEESRDNPVFYVHYAHARCNSALRQVADKMPHIAPNITPESPALQQADMGLLSSDGEMALIKLLAEYPRMIESAGANNEPHRIAYYLNDLATAFHSLWGQGRDDESLRFVQDDNPNLTTARCALVVATKSVIANGLAIFGVVPRESL